MLEKNKHTPNISLNQIMALYRGRSSIGRIFNVISQSKLLTDFIQRTTLMFFMKDGSNLPNQKAFNLLLTISLHPKNQK